MASRLWRRTVPLAMFVLLASSALACSGGEDTKSQDRIKELEQQVTTLKQQVEDAKKAAPPAATAVATKQVKDYGFTLTVPQEINLTASGTSAKDATKDAGQLAATSGNSSMVLVWTNQSLTAQEAVAGGFELLSASSTGYALQPTNQGEITVAGTKGAFGAFQVQKSNTMVGVGIVGGWRCENRTFSLTVLGPDIATVERSFAGLTGTFVCKA